MNAKVKYTVLDSKCKIGFIAEGAQEFETVPFSPDLIRPILQVLGVRAWEDLKNKFARIVVEKNKVVAVGNIIEDNWLELKITDIMS